MLASEVILQQILLLRMPLMAISRMNSSPFLTSNLVWITISLSSGNVNGMNTPGTNYTRFYQIGWSPSISLFNQTRRDCPFSFTYWSLTCNSFILVEWRGATLLSPATNPFHWNIFCCPVRIWHQIEVLQCKFTEGFFGHHLQLFERDEYFRQDVGWVFFLGGEAGKKYTLFLILKCLIVWMSEFWYGFFFLFFFSCGADSDLLLLYLFVYWYCLTRPDMTFAVDWTLQTNDLSICLSPPRWPCG